MLSATGFRQPAVQFSALRPRSYEQKVKIPANSWLNDKRADFFQESNEIRKVPLWRFIKLEEEIRSLASRIVYRTLFTSTLLAAMAEAVERMRQPGASQDPVQLTVQGLEKSPFWLGKLNSVAADGYSVPDSYYLEYRSPTISKRVNRVRIPMIYRNQRLGLPASDQNPRNHYQIRILPAADKEKTGSFLNLYMGSTTPGSDYGGVLSGDTSKTMGDIADIGSEAPLETLEAAEQLLNELFNRKRF